MKTRNELGKQRGFFTVGIGLALFAIFSAIGTGITVATEDREHDNDKLTLQTEVKSNPNSVSKLEN